MTILNIIFDIASPDEESNVVTVCTKIEDVRKSQPIAYKILQHLIDFAVEMGKTGSLETSANAVSKLLVHRLSTDQFQQHHVLFLMSHSKRMFNQPSPDDVNYSRCHLEIERKKQQIDHKKVSEFRSQ